MGGSTWRARRKSQRNRRGFPLGFVRGVRVHHGDVEVMSGGACSSAREKKQRGERGRSGDDDGPFLGWPGLELGCGQFFFFF